MSRRKAAKRRSRKPRGSRAGTAGASSSQPAGVQVAPVGRPARRAQTAPFGGLGERPQGLFGGLPVSEIAIAIGIVSLLIGYFSDKPAAIGAGAVICGLAVAEVTGREHFSGFRSHTALLAAIPAVVVETLLVVAFGEPSNRLVLLVPIVPVFALAFWWLKGRFEVARHARVTKPPAP